MTRSVTTAMEMVTLPSFVPVSDQVIVQASGADLTAATLVAVRLVCLQMDGKLEIL